MALSTDLPATATAEKLSALRQRIAAVVGPRGLIEEPTAKAPYLQDVGGYHRGASPFVVRPANTVEVSEVVRLCAEAAVPLVPQGGNTGLVGGGTPFESGGEVLISLSRLNRIRLVDAVEDSITVDAGCVLQQVQEAAAEAGRLFPLSLGAQGSCQIGGNISTNAGGVHVLRYGNMRDLVLGLEVVLPDGRIWDGLRSLRKDNTGYDLKQLFIGAEGTLGVITAACLKLFSRPNEQVTAFAGLPEVGAATKLFARTRSRLGESLSSFELLPRNGLELTLRHVTGTADPLAEPHAWYLLIEAGNATPSGLEEALQSLLAEALEAGELADAAIAQNAAQANAFWRLREGIAEALTTEGASIRHDIAVPVSAVPTFIEQACAAVEALVPGIRPIPFGHVGDGNIHFNLSRPEGGDREAFLARKTEVNQAVNDIVLGLGGSISAEHGIGRARLAENLRTKSAVEIELMARVKAALDPMNLMNPGKVVPAPHMEDRKEP